MTDKTLIRVTTSRDRLERHGLEPTIVAEIAGGYLHAVIKDDGAAHCSIGHEQHLPAEFWLDPTLYEDVNGKHHSEETAKTLERWNYNCTVFDIYEEVKELDEHDQRELLQAAHDFFSTEDSKAAIRDLAYHLGVGIRGGANWVN